jgi:hypothetical protein
LSIEGRLVVSGVRWHAGLVVVALAAFAAAAGGCAKQTESTSSTTASASSQPSPLDSASPAVALAVNSPSASAGPAMTAAPSSVSPLAAATLSVSVATSAPAAAVAGPSASPGTPSVHFTDVAGTFAEKQITAEAALNVYDSTSGAFRPHDPLTRAEYVRWLVRANNIYFAKAPAKQIRLAETAADPIFVDVAPSNPDYKYIQGMADAGYVIGIDKTHFAPARNLTREELIAIIVSRDQNGRPGTQAAAPDQSFSDANSISKPYWGAFHDDSWDYGMNTRGNVNRIFGTVKTLHPKRAATRGEAAIALAVIDGAGIP